MPRPMVQISIQKAIKESEYVGIVSSWHRRSITRYIHRTALVEPTMLDCPTLDDDALHRAGIFPENKAYNIT